MYSKILFSFLSLLLAISLGPTLSFSQEYAYVLLDKVNDEWSIAEMSLAYPEWKEGQEILKFNRNEFNIKTAFEKTGEWSNVDGIFECQKGNDKSKYTPCTSSFTSFHNTDFFGIAGKTRFKLNFNRLKEAMSESYMNNKVRECIDKNKDYALSQIGPSIKVITQINDQTGSYGGSKLYEIEPRGVDCFSELQDIRYIVNPSSEIYTIDIINPEFRICQDCEVNMVINIISKIDNVFSNSDINITIKRLRSMNGLPEIVYSIQNKSKSFLNIMQMQIYLDDKIVNLPIEYNQLSPMEVKNDVKQFFNVHGNISIDKLLSSNRPDSAKEIAIAIKYMLDGKEKSLFDTKTLLMDVIAKES